jgi:Protein of unknown function (DUF4238)
MNTRSDGPQNNPTRDQHTTTARLLKRFTDASSDKLKEYYLPRRREYDNSPSRAGRVKDYIRHDPQAHEDYWNTEVESHLSAAFAAVDDGTILDCPDLVMVLKKCIALHWARSAAYKKAHEELFENVTEQQKRQWLEDFRPVLERAFYFRYGLYPAGSEALEHINELLHEAPEIVTSGEFFAGRVRHNFDVARNHFASSNLEVARPPAGMQFLIGDSPALSIAVRNGQLYTKVPLFDAGTITLPIGPGHSIGLGGGGDKWIDLDESHVAQLNAMQVNEAVIWVRYHPRSGLKSFVDAVRSAAA